MVFFVCVVFSILHYRAVFRFCSVKTITCKSKIKKDSSTDSLDHRLKKVQRKFFQINFFLRGDAKKSGKKLKRIYV